MKRLTLLLLLLLTAMPVMAQTTTVTGTIVDPQGNPYSSGTVSAIKSVATGQNPGTPVAGTTSIVGTFSIILPSPASYIFTVCASPTQIGPTGNPTPVQVCFSNSVPITISGGSQDVSSSLNAVAKVLGPNITGVSGIVSTCTANQVPFYAVNGNVVACSSVITISGVTATVQNETVTGNEIVTGTNTVGVLSVGGTSTFTGAMTLTNGVTVGGAAALNGGATVNNGITVNGGSALNGGGTDSGAWTHSGNHTFNGATMTVNSNATHNGTDTFTNSAGVVTIGLFTNTQITNALSSFVNGTPFPYAGTGFMTAVAGGVITPSTATAINIDGIYGTAISNCNSVGRTICNTDGGYFSAQANANGAGVWGINPIALDVAGVANAHITGIEADIGVGGTPIFVRGQTIILTDGGGTVGTMPVNSIGLEILGTHTPTQQWNRAIQIDDGSSSLHALQIGAVNNGTSQGGQLIGFARWDGGGVRRTTESININSVGDFIFTQTGGGVSTLLHGMGSGQLLASGNGAGNAIQTARVASCTTGAAANSACSTTVTWANAFPNASYTVTCSLVNANQAQAAVTHISGVPIAASLSVEISNFSVATAASGTINCTGIHD